MARFRFLKLIPALAASILLLSCAHGYDTEKPELISGGLKIKSFLYVPRPLAPGRKYPAVVLNHGGMKGAELPLRAWGRDLASKGFVVIVPQFRGQGGSEGKFEFAHGEVGDSLAALDYIKSLPFVDSGKTGMVGYSLGGLVTLLAAERVKGLKAVVVMSALSDPAKFFEKAWKDKPDKQAQSHMSRVNEISPIQAIDRIEAPVLVVHGGMDGRVSVEQSKALYGALKSAGKDAELKIYPYAGHGILWDDAPREFTLKFLEKRLQ